MMRVAALYDIHGNLPALEAVLADVRQASFDEIVVGGDVYPGPMAGECLDLLLRLDCPVRFLRGNGDRKVLALAEGTDPEDGIPEAHRETMRWMAQRMGPDHRRTLASWPDTVCLTIDGLGEVLFCHATPRDDDEIFTRETRDDRLVEIFERPAVPIVVCGHTHMQFDRTIGGARVVNAGSIGMPFGEPGAYWLLLGPGVELRRTRYDFAKAAERIRSSTYPDAERFAERNVLQPPSEQEMLSLFSQAELK